MDPDQPAKCESTQSSRCPDLKSINKWTYKNCNERTLQRDNAYLDTGETFFGVPFPHDRIVQN